MTPEEIEAIVGGYHGDPFRILGPHAVRKRGTQARWEVRAFLPQAWWYATAPGIAIMLVVMGFNLLGDGLRDALDQRLR